jgi:hypothetical protein
MEAPYQDHLIQCAHFIVGLLIVSYVNESGDVSEQDEMLIC